MNKNDGNPAFPAPEASIARFGEGNADAFMGMSLRDYFAAKAMVSLTPVYWEDFELYGSGAELNKCLCETAYEMADQMLAERAK
jgi:hypothetical protein